MNEVETHTAAACAADAAAACAADAAAYAVYDAAADATAYTAYAAKKENQLKTANICRAILTEAVFEIVRKS